MNLEQARAIRMQIGLRPRTLYARLVRGRLLFDFDEPPWGSVEVGTYTHDVSPTELCDDVDAAEQELWAAAESGHPIFSVAAEDGSIVMTRTRAEAREFARVLTLSGKRARVIQEEAALAWS